MQGEFKMPDIRPINQDKYKISKHRFLELYHFCMQYQEWKSELKYLTDTVKGIDYSGEIKGTGTGSATERLAIRRGELRKKCELIEQTAMEADPEIYQYIIEGVTADYASYKYLKEVKGIPCCKNVYYDRRKKFYWLLSRKK